MSDHFIQYTLEFTDGSEPCISEEYIDILSWFYDFCNEQIEPDTERYKVERAKFKSLYWQYNGDGKKTYNDIDEEIYNLVNEQ